MDWFKRRIDTLAPDEYDRCLALMPAGRRAQAERHLRPQNRLATVLGEWMVKTALAERCRIPVEEIRLERTGQGKPYAAGLPLHFSVSHSGDWVAVALDRRPIGIDIEMLRPLDLRIAKRVCTQTELRLLFDGPPLFAPTADPLLLRRFFEIWTAKEAFFKQIGTGITDLQAVSYEKLRPLHFYEDGLILTVITAPEEPRRAP